MAIEKASVKNKNAINGNEVMNRYIFFISTVTFKALKIVHFAHMAKSKRQKKRNEYFINSQMKRLQNCNRILLMERFSLPETVVG